MGPIFPNKFCDPENHNLTRSLDSIKNCVGELLKNCLKSTFKFRNYKIQGRFMNCFK